MNGHLLTRRSLLAVAGATAAGLAGTPARAAGSRPITVFAAASLKDALEAVAADWTARTGTEVRISFAASSALARQIRHGAPADVFLSANADWMDALEADGLLAPGTRRDLLSNRLVLIAHGEVAAEIDELPALLGTGRLAVALVDAVPAGIYARAALTSLGLWEALAPRLAQTDNVRAALALVARGEAPFGIVYATDAAAERDVYVVAAFPENSHPPIRYPLAVTASSDHPDARPFAEALAGPAAVAVFRAHGFTAVVGSE